MTRILSLKMSALLSGALLFLAWHCSSPAFGTMMLFPKTWQNLVADAQFVGVVECTTAGISVVRCKVVDSWKGEANGTELTLRLRPNPGGPMFPMLLCGQRCLVAASRDKGPPNLQKNLTPLYSRRLKADYVIAPFYGMQAIVEGAFAGGQNSFARDGSSPEEFKRQVAEFLGKPEEEQERIRLLETVVAHFPKREESQAPLSPQLEAGMASILQSVSAHEAAKKVLRLLLSLPKSEQWDKQSLGNVLRDAGCDATIKVLEQIEKGEMQAEQIRVRMGLPPRHPGWIPDHTAPEEKPPTVAEVKHARASLIQENGRLDNDAVEIMAKAAPGEVAKVLKKWESPGADGEGGYVSGSLFGHYCGEDRERHLTALLEARDPWIRTAAAVYLCFESPDEGKAKLRELCKLEGGSGAWAALVLASRGEKAAVLRAMEVYPRGHKLHVSRYRLDEWQRRLSVLLSNSAAQSGLPTPDILLPITYNNDGLTTRDQYVEIKAWWEQSQQHMTLVDPWLPLLEKQKAD